jgi:signal transduction histidine kinase
MICVFVLTNDYEVLFSLIIFKIIHSIFLFLQKSLSNMKHSFQVITISIIVLLTLVLCGQIFWLLGLYKSIRQETYVTIMSTIETADFDEIAYRVKDIRNKDKKKMKENRQFAKQHTLSFHYDFDIYAQSPYKLMRLVDGGIHDILDHVEPINFKEFCRLIKNKCKTKGIDIDVCKVTFRNNKTGKTMRYHSPGMRIKDADILTYHNVEGNYTYTVWVTQSAIKWMDVEILNKPVYSVCASPLTSVYLYRMQGIIFTTITIILLLAVSFWYLIHTIVSLRSIEEMKDDFTNNMTHELKTPIAVTYSAVDTMLHFKQGDDKEKREQYLKICEQQLKRLSGLVEKILSMSMERRKTLAMNKEDVALLPMIESMAKEFRLKNDKKMTFIIDISPEDMTIHADPMHISNAISNIIDNSIKYSGDEVEIRIKAYHQADHDIIVLSDNGIGISEENLKRIFDKFYRVGHGNRYNVPGYGLGLYYVRQIIERHDGSISVASTLNKGTKFTITLPAKQ